MTTTRKPERYRPSWWEIAEMLMLARFREMRRSTPPRGFDGAGTPSDADVRLAREIVRSRRRRSRVPSEGWPGEADIPVDVLLDEGLTEQAVARRDTL